MKRCLFQFAVTGVTGIKAETDIKRELTEDKMPPFSDKDPQPGCSHSDNTPGHKVYSILYIVTFASLFADFYRRLTLKISINLRTIPSQSYRL
jgi:hypothetical protein